MSIDSLEMIDHPRLQDATMVVALAGWMDGGSVSTGTVKRLLEDRKLLELAVIDPGGFYIDNFPGSMEVASLFRPFVRYAEGLIQAFEMDTNQFYLDEPSNLIFFAGREPNLNWPSFADCIYEVARRAGVKRIIFVGSFGGAVPHTREPRLYGSVSERNLLDLLSKYALKPTEYEGPASFATYLLSRAPQEGLEMLSIAAEIPGYLQGDNPRCIEAVTKRLSKLLGLTVDFDKLRAASDTWEQQVSEAVEKDEDLEETVKKLEDEYDHELIESQMD